MKKARIINAVIWAVVAITVCTLVAVQWTKMGAGTSSLIAGIAFHLCTPALLCAIVDDKIRRAVR